MQEKLKNALEVIRELVEVHKIAEYASVIPLKLSCSNCKQPFICEGEDGEDDGDDDEEICKKCKISSDFSSSSKSKRIIEDEDKGADDEGAEVEVEAESVHIDDWHMIEDSKDCFQGRSGLKRSKLFGTAFNTDEGITLRFNDQVNPEFWVSGTISTEMLAKLEYHPDVWKKAPK